MIWVGGGGGGGMEEESGTRKICYIAATDAVP